MKINEKPLKLNARKKRLCPYIRDPFDECYVVTMASLNTEELLYYCGGNYKECAIYKKNVEKP